jgi:hypothetical protein
MASDQTFHFDCVEKQTEYGQVWFTLPVRTKKREGRKAVFSVSWLSYAVALCVFVTAQLHVLYRTG